MSKAEDAKFNEWLLKGGWKVTALPKGNREWNATAAVNAGDKITGKTK